MTEKEHYFDWAATAPADEDIQKEALSTALEHWETRPAYTMQDATQGKPLKKQGKAVQKALA